MLLLASDADVHGAIVRGLRRRQPGIDLVRVQDALAEKTPDADVLAWAAAQGRVLITNDRNTMVDHAYRRVTAAQPVPGLIVTALTWLGRTRSSHERYSFRSCGALDV